MAYGSLPVTILCKTSHLWDVYGYAVVSTGHTLPFGAFDVALLLTAAAPYRRGYAIRFLRKLRWLVGLCPPLVAATP